MSWRDDYYSPDEVARIQEIRRLRGVCRELEDCISELEKENQDLKKRLQNPEEAGKRDCHKEFLNALCVCLHNCADCYDDVTRQSECEPARRMNLYYVSDKGFSIEPCSEKLNQKLLRLAEEHGYIGELIKDGDDHFLHFFRCRAVGVVFQYASGEYELWEDIKLSPEEEAKVRNVFCAHKAEASTIKGFHKVLMKERKSENGKDY